MEEEGDVKDGGSTERRQGKARDEGAGKGRVEKGRGGWLYC